LEALVSEILKERQRRPTPDTNQPKNGN